MSDGKEQPPGNDVTGAVGAHEIEELYRLAEILMETSGADADATLSRRRVAKLRMDELLDSLNSAQSQQTQALADHKWVLDVLQDLAAYAEERDLAELHRILADARFLAFRALRKD